MFRYTVCVRTILILEVWGVPRPLSSSCEGLGGPSGPFRDLSIDYTESYTIQIGLLHPMGPWVPMIRGTSVWTLFGADSIVWTSEGGSVQHCLSCTRS